MTLRDQNADERLSDTQKAKLLRNQITAYARETAGTSADLDAELEAAGSADLEVVTERK